MGGRTRFEYDTRGRLIRITDPLGGVTTRTYTATDQVDSVTDPLGRVTTATYDPAGRQLSQTDPDGHTTTWAYDAAGREASTSVDGALIAAIERDLVRPAGGHHRPHRRGRGTRWSTNCALTAADS